VRVTTNSERAKSLLLCFVTLMLLLALAACQQAPPPQPADTRAADEAAIHAACDDSIKGFLAGDAAKWASYYADDTVIMAPDAPLIHGRAEAQKCAEGMLKEKPSGSFNMVKIEVARSGDVAYEWGTAKITIKDKKGKEVESTFKSLTALKKQADGSWKVAVDTLIPDPPAKPAAKQAK